ncbi:ATP-binding protein [Treponema sp.]|uniref:sensor histidine kinase n=1 Tax=Treponema sp. TaxID=166 RepID=UPI00388FF80A
MQENLKIRPYARLLTMLGDQLIKDERIALIELIKNSYDADASWVKVTFENFGENYEVLPESKIIIMDDGEGMTKKTLSTKFLNPATPGKKLKKQKNDKTAKGRIIQGEKGIGRFAMLKLGRKIDVISKTLDDDYEHILHYDFSKYDTDFLKENNKEKELFIDDLSVQLEERTPETFVKQDIVLGIKKDIQPAKGTVIEISKLNEGWTEEKVKNVANDIVKLQSIFDAITNTKQEKVKDNNSFFVYLYKDDDYKNYNENYINDLSVLIDQKTVLRIDDGFFDAETLEYSFKLNGVPQKISLYDSEICGIKKFKDYFKYVVDNQLLIKREIECGSFYFSFYVFDFTPTAPAKYLLDDEDKKKIRPHRIYLYRDGIRVYPYGEPEDDWLQIDTLRGTVSAGAFLSNDQVIGVVKISHSQNPRLKDKTNREGLIEDGYATSDFIKLLQVFLTYIRNKPYRQYQINNERRENQKKVVEKQLDSNFSLLRDIVKDNKDATEKLNEIEKDYKAEKQFLVRRAETTENLAGVGLSVETASHDIMRMMGLVLTNIDNLISEIMSVNEIDKETLLNELNSMRGSLGFVHAQLKDIQLLFTSSKQRRRNINVKEILDRVSKIYKNTAKKANVSIEVEEIPGSPLVAKTTDAVLLQVLLNLFDNSIYWLGTIDVENKKILITLDGENCKLIFSDNGPGVKDSDLPYIFESFYSGKGEEGRGLGLYIARQLLERNDYSIDYADLSSDKKLSGANFVVSFVSEGK